MEMNIKAFEMKRGDRQGLQLRKAKNCLRGYIQQFSTIGERSCKAEIWGKMSRAVRVYGSIDRMVEKQRRQRWNDGNGGKEGGGRAEELEKDKARASCRKRQIAEGRRESTLRKGSSGIYVQQTGRGRETRSQFWRVAEY